MTRSDREILTPPLSGPCAYPVILDLVDQVRAAEPAGEGAALMSALHRALAPDWHELVAAGIGSARRPGRQDIGASDEAPILQQTLASEAGRVLARVLGGQTLVVRDLRYWDHASRLCLERIVREPHGPRVRILAAAGDRLARSLAEAGSRVVLVPRARHRARGPIRDADLYLALCPHGLPLTVLERLGVPVLSDRATAIFADSANPGLILDATTRDAVCRAMPARARSRRHADLFDAIDPAGWGYIRRQQHAIGSRHAGRMVQQYAGSITGLMTLGYDFVYDLMAAMAPRLNGRAAVAARLGAGRLAPRLSRAGGRRMADQHFRHALALQRTAAARVSTLHELANLHASDRLNPAALERGARYYQRAFDLLRQVSSGPTRDDLEIRLRNGVALIDYRSRNGTAALEHERLALLLSQQRGRRDAPHWSLPLVLTNTSKLLLRLFDDRQGAVSWLEAIPEGQELRIDFSKRQNLARLFFEIGRFDAAAEQFAWCLRAENQPVSYSETEELYDLCACIMARLRLGEDVEPHLFERAAYLARVNDAPAGLALVQALRDRRNGEDRQGTGLASRHAEDRPDWLGRQDSNLGMAESKSAALPLGDAPTGPACPGGPL
jgi:tetratricopeptide (TPR) repeat protein